MALSRDRTADGCRDCSPLENHHVPFIHRGAQCRVARFRGPLHAHVTLDTPQAVALGYVRIAIRVPHGCEGAATTGLRLQVPEGVTAVKPQPKPGWTLTIVPDETPATGGGPNGLAHSGGELARR